MRNLLNTMRSSMAVNIIGAIILILLIFSIIVSVFGFTSFTSAFKSEYATVTYHMGDAAASVINGNHLEQYLAGEEKEEYQITKRRLDAMCKRLNVSLIYLIKVDESDYGRFVSIFNAVNNSVDDSNYTEWELGHKRDTTNEEYRKNYRALYAQEVPYATIFRTNPQDGSHPHITTMVPVKNINGDVTGIMCVQRPMREMADAIWPYFMNIALASFFMVLFSCFLIVVYLNKQFVEPVRKVSEEATRFASESTLAEPLGKISRFEELSSLAYSIDKMERDTLDYIDNLTRFTAEKERLNTELTFARQIQEESLPNDFPVFTDRQDFDLYASMTPAKAIGGDFYNFDLIDDDHLAVVIGDVSGKGIPASLFMMVSNIIISGRTRMGGSPAEIMTFTNNNICDHNEAGMFVTLWLGIIELSTGSVTAVNAGHCDAAVCRSDGRVELVKTKHNIAAGVMPGVSYTDFSIQLEKGDKLFLYTDGVPEAMDPENNMFTVDSTLDTLREFQNGSPKEILEGVHKRVNEFAGDAPQFDDLTMLCFELKE